jgi:hypothetical protein
VAQKKVHGMVELRRDWWEWLCWDCQIWWPGRCTGWPWRGWPKGLNPVLIPTKWTLSLQCGSHPPGNPWYNVTAAKTNLWWKHYRK